jgi:hypothetical protein
MTTCRRRQVSGAGSSVALAACPDFPAYHFRQYTGTSLVSCLLALIWSYFQPFPRTWCQRHCSTDTYTQTLSTVIHPPKNIMYGKKRFSPRNFLPISRSSQGAAPAFVDVTRPTLQQKYSRLALEREGAQGERRREDKAVRAPIKISPGRNLEDERHPSTCVIPKELSFL